MITRRVGRNRQRLLNLRPRLALPGNQEFLIRFRAMEETSAREYLCGHLAVSSANLALLNGGQVRGSEGQNRGEP
jgi:hypothetical protein